MVGGTFGNRIEPAARAKGRSARPGVTERQCLALGCAGVGWSEQPRRIGEPPAVCGASPTAMRRTAAVLLASVLLVTACGDGDDPVATGARRSTTTSSSSSTTSTTATPDATTDTTAGGGGGGTTGGATGGGTSDPGLPAGSATIRDRRRWRVRAPRLRLSRPSRPWS